MTLGDELYTLREQRSTGRVSPADYYLGLARLLDTPQSPSEAPSDPMDVCRTNIRRIGALLDGKFGTLGTTLREKIGSLREPIPADLRAALDSIANYEALVDQWWGPPFTQFDYIQRCCTWAQPELIRQAPRPEALFPTQAACGIVRKIRLTERPFRAGSRKFQYSAVMDIDGHIGMLRSGMPIQIDAGDRIVVAGVDDIGSLYYNESKRSELPRPAKAAKRCLAIAGAALLSGAGMVTAAPKSLLLGVSGILLLLVGLLIAGIGIHGLRLSRAFEEKLREFTPPHSPPQSPDPGRSFQ